MAIPATVTMMYVRLKFTINALIFASVALGALLIVQLHSMVPGWLFNSVAMGWVAYLIVALAAARGHEAAYPAALVLSILTLLVSLPQPEHYGFMKDGFNLPALTFIVGSVLQVAQIILIPVYIFRRRRR